MNFLYPLLGLAALGVAFPIWLHLRRKWETNVVKFSALRFLDDQPQPKSRSFRIRDPLLFAFRLLALLLVVGAFTWPYLVGDAARRAVSESRVHVLDNTLSRQVDGGFEKDRDRILREIRNSGSEVQHAVVELTAQPRVVVGFGEGRGTAEERLLALAPSHQRGAYPEAFRLAGSLLSRSLGSKKTLVVYGDGQENQWSEAESSPPFLEGTEVVLASQPGEEVRPNLAVGEPRARLFFVGDETFVDLSVELRHQGGVRRAAITLTLNGREVRREHVTLEGAPPVITVRGQWTTDPAQWLRGVVSIEPIEGERDDLAADNRSWFCLPPVREGRVALLARSLYLRTALSPEVAKGRWKAVPVDPANPGDGELADVLLLEADAAQSHAARDLVRRYLNNERGVVLLVNRATPLVKGFLNELGYDVREKGAEGEDGFRFFSVRHPIFQPFRSGELGDLSEVRVLRHTHLVSREASPLIYGASGEPLVFEGGEGQGRLLVFSFGLDRTDTDWPIHPTFLPFLDLALQHARAAAPVETSAVPGGLWAWRLPEGASARSIVLYQKDREVARAAVDESRRASLRMPDAPGIYTVAYDQSREVRGLVAVNPSPKESRLTYVKEPPVLAVWRSAPKSEEPKPEAPAPELAARAGALDQRVWWWLLLAGSAFLLFETVSLVLRREVP
ncbi:MAG TPA: BatA and WFA domain-containing protein [Thermoanaerobaculia bacterium]|nr:BatA and WFA domain-containing protein [Thermoanaerobaculia bacterium]